MNIVVCIDYTILKREEEIEVEVEKLVFGLCDFLQFTLFRSTSGEQCM